MSHLQEGKKSHRRSREAKQRRSRKRVRHISEVEETKASKGKQQTPKLCKEENLRRVRFGTAIHTTNNKYAGLIKGAFSAKQMESLAKCLLEENADGWEDKKDPSRGDKIFFITGSWTAKGHFIPGVDKIYPAGQAGKRPLERRQPCHNALLPFAQTAASLLRRHRPELMPTLDQLPAQVRIFDLFPLFMSTQGVAKIHKDRNDFVTFLFLIKSDGTGGELEIIGTNICFA